jgi:C4-dicarboxylate-specific signal transduction histidine kinase
MRISVVLMSLLEHDSWTTRQFLDVAKQLTHDRFGAAELPGITERAVREWQKIRRRREAEKALMQVSRLATIEELIAGISHEVNQPLFAVKNLSLACRKIHVQPSPTWNS